MVRKFPEFSRFSLSCTNPGLANPCFITLMKVVLVSARVALRMSFCKTGSFRKWSITFHSFGLKQFGKHVVGYAFLYCDTKFNIFLNTYLQNL